MNYAFTGYDVRHSKNENENARGPFNGEVVLFSVSLIDVDETTDEFC